MNFSEEIKIDKFTNVKGVHKTLKYIPVIGMEVHAEMKTASKMFCACKNDMGLEKSPNVNICPVCTGQPGALPVPNREAIRFVQKVGLALGCRVNKVSKFDRKNYFYPDLPKGYQISQYDEPLVEAGEMGVGGEKIRITRVHMEEDTGRSQHPKGTDYSLVDLNRSSVPLMELVTEPDVTSGEQAKKFCQKLQQVLRYLEVSDADMEKGQMRCEANISLYKEGENKLSGTKVEVKNLNSFKVVEKAVAYEIKRQTEALENGELIAQETRGWDEGSQTTVSQRSKESAHDYRYFPEPDIPPMEFDEEYIEGIRRELPEMPDAKADRFQREYGLSEQHAEELALDKNMASYFEHAVSEIYEKKKSKEFSGDEKRAVQLAANYMLGELKKHLVEGNDDIRDIKITPENFGELMTIVAEGKVNSSAAQTVLGEMYANGEDPSDIIEKKDLAQMDDSSALEGVVDEVLAKNQKSVEDYRSGKENAIKYLMGQVMAATKGKANPGVVMGILKERIKG